MIAKLPAYVDEKRHLQISDSELYKKVIRQFKPKTRLWVGIWRKEEDEKKNWPRRYYFAVVAELIARETGHSKEKIHEAMKVKYSSYQDEVTELTIIESVFSDMSGKKFKQQLEFIDNVKRWAFDFLDLPIPEPTTVIE